MLSILIPVYNWDITSLVKQIHAQCEELSIEYEIVVLDDLSPDLALRKVNSDLKLDHYKYIQSDENLGNGQARNHLSGLAKFDWLIFLDADVELVSEYFVKRYRQLALNQNENTVFCGGLLYKDGFKQDGVLRWKYGRKLEVQAPMEAQKDPYLNFKSCNFLLKKKVIETTPFNKMEENYGFDDTSFALSLEKFDVKINYVDNPVFHLGLESNEKFIIKSESSVKNAFWLLRNRPDFAEKLRIVRVYKILQKWKVKKIFSILFKIGKSAILNNLYSQNPSLFLFQVYKLGYLCSLKEE